MQDILIYKLPFYLDAKTYFSYVQAFRIPYNITLLLMDKFSRPAEYSDVGYYFTDGIKNIFINALGWKFSILPNKNCHGIYSIYNIFKKTSETGMFVNGLRCGIITITSLQGTKYIKYIDGVEVNQTHRMRLKK